MVRDNSYFLLFFAFSQSVQDHVAYSVGTANRDGGLSQCPTHFLSVQTIERPDQSSLSVSFVSTLNRLISFDLQSDGMEMEREREWHDM